ncbi:MAG: hypothetical protein LBT92_02925 [Rickettsiales bacterium]|jgi:hypothetical protein|nr:hypothetical protein [Rickettsiales bacterium]
MTDASIIAIAALFICAPAFAADIMWTRARGDDTEIYKYNTGEDKDEAAATYPGRVIDVIDKGRWRYVFTDGAMFAEDRKSAYPFKCGTTEKEGDSLVRRTFCRPYIQDGSVMIRHSQQDTNISFDSEGEPFESHDVAHTFWAFDGSGFSLVGNDRQKFDNSHPAAFARAESAFTDTWDKDYWSLARKSSEAWWNYRYDGRPAYTARISRGSGAVWASEPAIKDRGEDIEITAAMHRDSTADEKTVKFTLDGFLKSELINDSINKTAVPKRFALLEAAGGKYYIMANLAPGFDEHIADYFYILKPGETTFAKIAPPKAAGEAFAIQALDTLSLSPTHVMVSANRGKRYLYNLDGRPIRTFENADKAAFMP